MASAPRNATVVLAALIAVSALPAVAHPALAQNVRGHDPAVNTTSYAGEGIGAIPDAPIGGAACGVAGATRDVTFPVNRVFGDLHEVRVDFTLSPGHIFVGDLDVVLIAPGGAASHTLLSRVGELTPEGCGDNSDLVGTYTFTDFAFQDFSLWERAEQAGNSDVIPVGSYLATAPGGGPGGGAATSMVGAFAGLTDFTGLWTLRFTDLNQGDTAGVSAATLSFRWSVTPELTSSATQQVELGAQITDTATLSGGADPGGTISFDLYGPDDPACTGPSIFFASVPVMGNGSYGSPGYTPTAEGVYRWIASYHGDNAHWDDIGACNDPGETSVVGSVEPPPGPGVVVVAGEDNVARAIAWSQVTNPDSGFAGGPALAETVLLGRDDVFADSLASGGAQGLLDAPLLLTGQAELDGRTTDELERLGATDVVLLGGEAALSAEVEEALDAAGYATRRVSGASRLETAVAVAEHVAPDATGVVLARAFPAAGAGDPTQAFADALAGGVLAAGARLPLLLTETDRLSEPAAEWLGGGDVTTAWVLGGAAAVAQAVLDDLEDLGITVQRLGGPSRADTAVLIATDGLDLADAGEAGAVVLVDGQDPDAWADAFPAALLTARDQGAIVLAAGTELPDATTGWLVASPATLVCGSTVSAAACDDAEAVLHG